jgi:hypothetical protein
VDQTTNTLDGNFSAQHSMQSEKMALGQEWAHVCKLAPSLPPVHDELGAEVEAGMGWHLLGSGPCTTLPVIFMFFTA